MEAFLKNKNKEQIKIQNKRGKNPRQVFFVLKLLSITIDAFFVWNHLAGDENIEDIVNIKTYENIVTLFVFRENS